MAEIKEFQPSTKESPKPEKPAGIFDIEEARREKYAKETVPSAPFVFPDTESEELMETVSGLVKKLFEESRDKKVVVEQLRKLADELEQALRK